MERMAGAGTVAVTKDEVRTALGRSKTLTSEEEKALRMRFGVGAQTTREPLPRAAGGNAELSDELLIIEMQLMKAWRLRLLQQRGAAMKNAAVSKTGASREKDKIVRALRKKR